MMLILLTNMVNNISVSDDITSILNFRAIILNTGTVISNILWRRRSCTSTAVVMTIIVWFEQKSNGGTTTSVSVFWRTRFILLFSMDDVFRWGMGYLVIYYFICVCSFLMLKKWLKNPIRLFQITLIIRRRYSELA